MKTLYDKLKEPFRKILEWNVKNQYPTTHDSIVESLKKEFVIDLTYAEINDLNQFLNNWDWKFELTHTYNFFEDEKNK